MKQIYLDSCIIIYLVERHPIFASIIQSKLEALENVTLTISPLVRLEVLVKPLREKQTALINLYERFLSEQQSLTMPNPVFDVALSLRVEHNLKTPDALHLATAQYHDCKYFWTNDNRLSAIVPDLVVNVCS